MNHRLKSSRSYWFEIGFLVYSTPDKVSSFGILLSDGRRWIRVYLRVLVSGGLALVGGFIADHSVQWIADGANAQQLQVVAVDNQQSQVAVQLPGKRLWLWMWNCDDWYMSFMAPMEGTCPPLHLDKKVNYFTIGKLEREEKDWLFNRTMGGEPALHSSTDKTEPMMKKNESLNKLHIASLLYPRVWYMGTKFTNNHQTVTAMTLASTPIMNDI